MTRDSIYDAISDEREYQEKKYGDDGKNRKLSEYLIDIRHHIQETENALYSFDEEEALHQFRKIAALAVAAMEDNGIRHR